MKRSGLSYGFLLAFLVTAFALGFWRPPVLPPAFFVVLGGITGGMLMLFFLLQKRTTAFGIAASAGIGILTAFMSVALATHQSAPDDIESFANGETVSIHGWIAEPADIRPTVTKLTIGVDGVTLNGENRTARGRVLVNIYGGVWPPLEYGDEVTATGKLALPEVIDDFDYPHYLELSGIRALITRGSIHASREGRLPPPSARTWRALRFLTDLRTRVENRIGLILPEPQASLLAGLLTGTRRGLPAHISEEFRIAGITHIIAVSGFNVTIVLTLLGGLLFWIPVRKRLLPLSLGAVLFCLFVGGGAPVVRATIMGILGLIALSAERITTTRLTILWTAFLMVVIHPATLWYDASFQLSFLAVIGIAELSHPLQKWLRRVPETLAMRESLTATLAAEVTTVPVSVFLFHQFSLVAPLTNILVAPLIPLTMLLGSVAILLSVIWMPLGLIAGYVTWFLLSCIITIAHLCAAVPFAALPL